MNSEKRLLLAVAVSFLILILYPFYLKWISPPSSVPPPKLEQASSVSPEGSAAPVSPVFVSTEERATTPSRKGNIYKFSHERFDVEFSDLGGTITRLELKNWGKKQHGEVLFPSYKYLTGDNAAMIGVVAGFKAEKDLFVKNGKYSLTDEAVKRITSKDEAGAEAEECQYRHH